MIDALRSAMASGPNRIALTTAARVMAGPSYRRALAFTAMSPGSLRKNAAAFDRTQMPWQSVRLPQSQDKPPLARLAPTALRGRVGA